MSIRVISKSERKINEAVRLDSFENVPPVGATILINEVGRGESGVTFAQCNKRFCCKVLSVSHKRLVFVEVYVTPTFCIKKSLHRADFAKNIRWKIVTEIAYCGEGYATYEELSLENYKTVVAANN